RDTLVVEVEDLFPEVEVLERGRTAAAGLQGILVVGDRAALRRGQDRGRAGGGLVQLAAFTAAELLVMDLGGRLRRDGGLLGGFWHGRLLVDNVTGRRQGIGATLRKPGPRNGVAPFLRKSP